jgi:hypothetical protein
MSRQYNPAIAAYKNLQIVEDKGQQSKPTSKGLLTPRNPKEQMIEASAGQQPMARVAEHVKTIRKRRMNRNGN